ncbi:hypothetical protein EJB05_14626, partial [Eragrostis curvula]
MVRARTASMLLRPRDTSLQAAFDEFKARVTVVVEKNGCVSGLPADEDDVLGGAGSFRGGADEVMELLDCKAPTQDQFVGVEAAAKASPPLARIRAEHFLVLHATAVGRTASSFIGADRDGVNGVFIWKGLELELSWICDEWNRQHQKIPNDLLEQANIAAQTGAVAAIVVLVLILLGVCKCLKKLDALDTSGNGLDEEAVSDRRIRGMTIDKFLSKITVQGKPLRFKRSQIIGFTRDYSTRLGAGRFGTVFKGTLPNGLAVAVKVLHRKLHVEEAQFMAAVRTMWSAGRHENVVKLFGFCLHDEHPTMRALVYEYGNNGALDAYLLHDVGVGLPALLEIAVGVARGIRHLHEECKEKVVHYDVKLSNVLLDAALTPKLVDVGLALLVNPDTHVTMSNLPDTPGYIAPEARVQQDITEKRDVYSFGMLLLEIVGRRRIHEEAAPDGQQWYPELAWSRYESGNLMELVSVPSDDHIILAVDDDAQQCKELVERMCKVAFWCVQQQPTARPPMGDVVNMLEGNMDIVPPVNPFRWWPTCGQRRQVAGTRSQQVVFQMVST